MDEIALKSAPSGAYRNQPGQSAVATRLWLDSNGIIWCSIIWSSGADTQSVYLFSPISSECHPATFSIFYLFGGSLFNSLPAIAWAMNSTWRGETFAAELSGNYITLHYIELFFSVIEPQQNANIYLSNSHFNIRACTTVYVWKIPYVVLMITP